MSASDQIDSFIAGVDGWRGETLAHLRQTISAADARLSEDWKWSTPVWIYKGNVCAIAAFKDHVKINFFKGAQVSDAAGLFNAGLEAKASRSIDLAEGEQIDGAALRALVRAAADLNQR
jgi:hypothetical protein